MDNHDPGALVRAIFGGPTVYMIFIGSLAVVVMIAGALRRLDGLVYKTQNAARRMQQSSVFPMIWGFAAGLFLVALSAILFHLPPHVRVLGLVSVGLFLALGGIGSASAALALGRAACRATAPELSDDLTAVRLGLSLFLAAEFVPIVGWLVVFLATCAGAGAFLEALFEKQTDPTA